MSDSFWPALMRALDLFVVERRSDGSFASITPVPDWMAAARTPADESPIAPAIAFPFLEAFLPDAEAFWVSDTERCLRSGLFYAPGESNLVLRAAAVNLPERKVLVVEPIDGVADVRAVLQRARENELAYERLAERIAVAGKAVAPIRKLIDELLVSDLPSVQREKLKAVAARCVLLASTVGWSPNTQPGE